jgi:CRP-like cAMP-binding protein
VAHVDLQDVTTSAADTSDPVAGLRAMRSLRLLADRLELQQVEAALRAGLTWQDIAASLGLTRQAVHRKYVKRIDPSIPVRRRRRS